MDARPERTPRVKLGATGKKAAPFVRAYFDPDRSDPPNTFAARVAQTPQLCERNINYLHLHLVVLSQSKI